MIFYGLQKTTLLDYPGHIASLLFTGRCNMRCPFCHNPTLVDAPLKETIVEEEEIFQHLEKRKGIVEGVCITGGEPLLHGENLLVFIKKIKAMGLKVKIDTNGTFPEYLKQAEVDYIAMDIKTAIDKYFPLFSSADRIEEQKKNILQSINYIKNSGIPYEFRTTVVPGLVTPEDINTIASHLLSDTNNYVLNQFRPQNALDPSYRSLTPYSLEVLEQMKEISEKYNIICTIRANYSI